MISYSVDKFVYIGRITWARSLHLNLKELVVKVTAHPVLRTLPDITECEKKFESIAQALEEYEKELIDVWMNHNVRIATRSLSFLFPLFYPKRIDIRITGLGS